jgi:Domain of unknown function (DUF892)
MPPDSIRNVMHPSMTSAEQELMQSVEDTIVESAEVTGYNLLIQMAGKMNNMSDAIPSLRQSLQEEEKMFTWLRANAPAMFAKLWPQIEESLSSSSSSSSTSKIKTTTENVEDINQTFKCESCNETFNSREELRQHTIQNHENK